MKCKCKCGQIVKKGKKYIRGHNLRVNNPMKNLEIVKKVHKKLKEKWKKEIHPNTGRKRPDVSKRMKENNPMKNVKIAKKVGMTFHKNYVNGLYKEQFIKRELKSRRIRIRNGNQVPDELLSEFEKYFKNVQIETRKWRKQLFDKWDGIDYYTGKNIKKYKNIKNYNHKKYPIIEHKTSISHGFKNNINPKIIGNINNLCICSRSINSKKRSKTENEFKIRKQDSLTGEHQAHETIQPFFSLVILKGGLENPGDGCATQSPAIKYGGLGNERN